MLTRCYERWDVIDEGVLIALRELGLAETRIAELIGRSFCALRSRSDLLIKLGLTRKRRAVVNEQMSVRISWMWVHGVQNQDIAKATGLHIDTIRRWSRRLKLPARSHPGTLWVQSQDDDFLLRWYGRKHPRWIGQNLPSGRKVSRDAVIGRHHRLKIKGRKITPQAREQHERRAAPCR